MLYFCHAVICGGVTFDRKENLEEAVNAAIDLFLAKGWKLESIYPTGDDKIFNESVKIGLERRVGEVESSMEIMR